MYNSNKEIIQRLQTAHERTTKMFEQVPINKELDPGTEIANFWPFITVAYSGLEQTLKFLLAIQKSCTIEELLKTSPTEYKRVGEQNGQAKLKSHDLSKLFIELEDQTKKKLEDYYKQFQSLHSYIKIMNLENFFKEISGSEGRGYELWRYSLIEFEKNLPITSPEGMLSIWGYCLEICEHNIFNNHQPRLIDKKINFFFKQKLTTAYRNASIQSQENGKPFVDYRTEIKNECLKHDGLLNFLAHELLNFRKFQSSSASCKLEGFSEIIKEWIENILESQKNWGLSSEWYFVQRAIGNRGFPSESIRFNQETKLFEDIPWSLDSECIKNLPNGANKFVDNSGKRLAWLRKTSIEEGYKIKENRSFVCYDSSKRNYWHRVMLIYKSLDKEPILSIWQKVHGYKNFHLTIENPSKLNSKKINLWIKNNKINSK